MLVFRTRAVLTAEQWQKVRAEFEAGGCTAKSLANKWGVSSTGIINRARTQKWRGYYSRAEAMNPERLRARRMEQIAVVQSMAEELGRTPAKREIEARGIFFGRLYPFMRAGDLITAAQLPARRRGSMGRRSLAKVDAVLSGAAPRKFKVRRCLACFQKTTSEPCSHCGTAWDATPKAA